MAHKTFISYKYSEAQGLRDRIIKALGDDATYYTGETSDSPDLSDTSTGNIRRVLSDMIYQISVTIVIISPNMIQSKWIDWEIEYSLKEINRANRHSKTNGIVGVVMKHLGGYSWLRPEHKNPDGCSSIATNDSYLYDIIKNNRFNQNPKVYSCDVCKTVDSLTGSYISLVNEDDFLSNPQKYIDNAFDKSENDASGYDITKQK
ncbi:hypothetical protein FACS189432_04660 [Bacteroidia bacterium]|nr:hypothetical protein FACS189426_22650 [Bacteroidia bacterium]GHT27717.1 hypothetical protein FACS189432_04660 [Bacteroidia bacterium]